MKSQLHTQAVALGFLIAPLILSVSPKAHAQFTYTYYPTDAPLNSMVSTDFAIVGFAGGSYDENDFSRHFTSPSSPTIQVVAGADVSSEMDLFNNSLVYLSGGSVAAIVPYDNSTLTISSGNSSYVLGEDHSSINILGGTVDDLEGQGKQINVSGGTLGTLVANVNTDFQGNSLGSCFVNVTGGSITGEANALNAGVLNLYGGLFGGDLRAAEGGTINIYGSGLVASLLNPNYTNGYSLYSLSGTLEDGTVLTNKNLRIRNDGVTYGHSSFHLVNAVPEPSSLALLLGLGASGVSLLRSRRKRGTNLSDMKSPLDTVR